MDDLEQLLRTLRYPSEDVGFVHNQDPGVRRPLALAISTIFADLPAVSSRDQAW